VYHTEMGSDFTVGLRSYAVETDSNLGNLFPWWDRLFGTYLAETAPGHEGMVIGLERFRNAADLTLPRMLVNPFVRE
jgi:sterol desaturase/sphingolipid hydroxylase (fatty acid hydroxylase superfamily)